MTTLAPSRRGRTLATALGSGLSLALLALATALPGLAQDSAPQRLTPDQQQRIFPERRTQLLRHHKERIQTLQKSERCINAARDTAALNGCLQEERRENQAQRQKHREAMRSIYQRNGIEVPVGGPGGRGGGAGGGKGRRAM
ncbi:hypothetical protein [Cyanobium sp. CH-040]|uniref:hypothetical protein n=1 Tax=Cyanobium sp. CH-040 TaxID=2823708 RepID=UPI0020CBB00F|nr:hypothetical protein [Cyanobium sp. CH-040]MCP9929049.1 hypothetical protein [Cyanobium sp. CH-040]